jgi:hypothetical protein
MGITSHVIITMIGSQRDVGVLLFDEEGRPHTGNVPGALPRSEHGHYLSCHRLATRRRLFAFDEEAHTGNVPGVQPLSEHDVALPM